MTPGRSVPPRWMERLVGRVLSGPSRADVLGDLHEGYASRASAGRTAARGWYAWQAVQLIAPALLSGARRAAMAVVIDLRAARRGVFRRRGVMAVAVVSLALGLGLATAVFTVVNGLLLAPLPYRAPDTLIDLDEVHPTDVCDGCSVGAPAEALPVWRAAETLAAVEAFDGGSAVVQVNGVRARASVTRATPGLAPLLGLRVQAGAMPSAGLAGVATAVLSPGAARRWFGDAAGAVGGTLAIDGAPFVIAGVLHPATPFPAGADVIVFARMDSSGGASGGGRVSVVARMASGVALADVGAELEGLHARLEDGRRAAAGWRPRARPLREALADDLDDPTGAAFALAGSLLVLLVACLNVCVVLTARVADRADELAVRRALGAHRRRLAQLVLSEVAWLAAIAGVLSVLLAMVARGALVSALGGVLPPWVSFPVDLRVLAAAAALAMLAVVLAGLPPAVTAAGLVDRRAVSAWRSARGVAPRRRLRWLVAGQVALGMVLVTGSLDAARTAARVRDFSNLGHRVDGLSTVSTTVMPDAFDGPNARAARWRTLRDGLTAMPDVDAVSAEQPLFLGSFGGPESPSALRLDGQAEAVPDAMVPRHSLAVAPGWFDVMDVSILRGRAIDERDREGASGALVVSAAAASTLWGDGVDPMGQVVHLDGWPAPLVVVGIAADVVGNPASESRRVLPRVYASLLQAPAANATTWIIAVAAEAAPANWPARFATLAPDLLVTEAGPLAFGLRRWTAPAVGVAWALTATGTVAMLLLGLGVHGTLRYHVALTSREIGIRRALGAGPSSVAGAVAGGLGRWLGAAAAAGALLAWLLGWTVAADGLGSTDPVLIGTAAVMVLAAAVLAGAGAVRRALAASPLAALRGE